MSKSCNYGFLNYPCWPIFVYEVKKDTLIRLRFIWLLMKRIKAFRAKYIVTAWPVWVSNLQNYEKLIRPNTWFSRIWSLQGKTKTNSCSGLPLLEISCLYFIFIEDKSKSFALDPWNRLEVAWIFQFGCGFVSGTFERFAFYILLFLYVWWENNNIEACHIFIWPYFI